MRIFRTIGIVGASAGLLLSSSVVLAQEPGPGRLPKGPEGERGMMVASTTRKQIGENIRERLQNVRQEANERVKQMREKAQIRLADIKDQKKQDMAQKLALRFEELNATWTERFAETLDRLDAVLKKIQDRANIAKENGKDISSTTAAIEKARTAIATARTAVIAQAAKTYTLDTSTLPVVATTTPSGQESLMKSFRTKFQALHTGLFKDLFALRDGPMKNARKAVQEALVTLMKVNGVDDDRQATTTAETN